MRLELEARKVLAALKVEFQYMDNVLEVLATNHKARQDLDNLVHLFIDTRKKGE
jgi:hypothetical protein